MSTSTPASDSARYETLRQFPRDLSKTAGSPTASAPAGFAVDPPAEQQTGDYVVAFVNQTGETVLNHFAIRFILTGIPEVQEAARIDVNLQPGRRAGFIIPGRCSTLEAYVVASFIGPADNPTVYQQIPKANDPRGPMTPERSSQDNPNDPGPCSDLLEFTFQPG